MGRQNVFYLLFVVGFQGEVLEGEVVSDAHDVAEPGERGEQEERAADEKVNVARAPRDEAQEPVVHRLKSEGEGLRVGWLGPK